MVESAGLNLYDLTDEQKAAAMQVLEALLDDEAYATVTGIIGGDHLGINATLGGDANSVTQQEATGMGGGPRGGG